MTFQELQQQVLQLSIGERWRLVRSVLTSIQQETFFSRYPSPSTQPLTDLDPWTQSFIGVIQLEAEDTNAAYLDYLEEKYR